MSLRTDRMTIAIGPALALAWLWLARPSPAVAVVAATVAFAGAAHGWGRAIGRALGDDDAPAALAIGWGVAAWLLTGGALAAVGAPAADVHDAVVLLGIVAGVACAGTAARGTSGASPRSSCVPALIAIGLALIAIAAAAAAVAPAPAVPAVLTAVSDDLGRAAALRVHPAFADEGWGFALTLALLVTITARAATPARVLIVLLVASLPVDAIGGVRWLAAAGAIVIAMTATRPRSVRRRAITIVGVIGAVAVVAVADPRATSAGIALGAVAWLCGRGLGDDEAAYAALAGQTPPRALLAIAAAVAAVLAIVGARSPVGHPPRSWPDRLDARIDAATSLFHARRAPTR